MIDILGAIINNSRNVNYYEQLQVTEIEIRQKIRIPNQLMNQSRFRLKLKLHKDNNNYASDVMVNAEPQWLVPI